MPLNNTFGTHIFDPVIPPADGPTLLDRTGGNPDIIQLSNGTIVVSYQTSGPGVISALDPVTGAYAFNDIILGDILIEPTYTQWEEVWHLRLQALDDGGFAASWIEFQNRGGSPDQDINIQLAKFSADGEWQQQIEIDLGKGMQGNEPFAAPTLVPFGDGFAMMHMSTHRTDATVRFFTNDLVSFGDVIEVEASSTPSMLDLGTGDAFLTMHPYYARTGRELLVLDTDDGSVRSEHVTPLFVGASMSRFGNVVALLGHRGFELGTVDTALEIATDPLFGWYTTPEILNEFQDSDWQVTTTPDGGLIYTFSGNLGSDTSRPQSAEVYALHYGPDGAQLGELQRINTGLGRDREVNPNGIMLQDGRFAMVWDDWYWDENWQPEFASLAIYDIVEAVPDVFRAADPAGGRLVSGSGHDTVAGGMGEDSLYAGEGDDLAYGGASDDFVDGDAGEDTLYGGIGDDTVIGGAGRDTIGGGPGDDSLMGWTEDDIIWTGAGNDTALGGYGDDMLGGWQGDDSLSGGLGDDEIWGADGNDTLDGGPGSDLIGGGNGDDVIKGTWQSTIWGGAGHDHITGGGFVGAGPGNDTINASNAEATIFGGWGDDSIDAWFGDDFVGGGPGDDTINGGRGNDTIYGGADDDEILGRGENDLIYGNSGDDTLNGSEGDDTLIGGPGADTFVFFSRSGHDTFEATLADTLQISPQLWSSYPLFSVDPPDSEIETGFDVVTRFGRVEGGDLVLDFSPYSIGDSITLRGMGDLSLLLVGNMLDFG